MENDAVEWDLRSLEGMWERRRARVAAVLTRANRRGMTRPRRNSAEREWLLARRELPPIMEVDTPLNDRGSCPQPSRGVE